MTTTGESFDAFVQARSPALLRTAFLLTGDAHLAQDLVQTALAKVWRAWRRIERQESAEAYARKALVTTASSWWRRRWHGERPTGEMPEPPPGRGEDYDAVDARLVLLAALRRLPTRQRIAVVLRYYEDLPDEVVAQLMGTSASTVRSQAARGLAALRADGGLALWATVPAPALERNQT